MGESKVFVSCDASNGAAVLGISKETWICALGTRNGEHLRNAGREIPL